ncbi:DUF4303 domain-containing protein [bacterium]|nr:DUF4303 domain-containing protein [bacterium]
MDIKRLREITQTLGDHTSGQRVDITFHKTTERLGLSVTSPNAERYEKLQVLLDDYKDEFIMIENYRVTDSTLDWQFIQKIDFLDLCSKMAEGIKAEIEALIQTPPADPIYAFVVGISPDHMSLETSANSESAWQSHNKHNDSSGISSEGAGKYFVPEFTLEHARAGKKPWDPLYETLEKIQKISEEYYELTGGIGRFHQFFDRRFTQMAVHALKQNMHLFKQVSTTQEFVAYVQDYVGNGDDAFTALETVPVERVREMFPSII